MIIHSIKRQIALRANKIVQYCFLEVVVGNRGTKGAMITSFFRARCSKFSIRNKSAKKQMLKQIVNEVYQ